MSCPLTFVVWTINSQVALKRTCAGCDCQNFKSNDRSKSCSLPLRSVNSVLIESVASRHFCIHKHPASTIGVVGCWQVVNLIWLKGSNVFRCVEFFSQDAQ